MPSPSSRRALRRPAAVAAALLAAVLLAGCVPEQPAPTGQDRTTPSATEGVLAGPTNPITGATPTPAASSTPSATPTPSATQSAGGTTPVGFDCARLLPPDKLYGTASHLIAGGAISPDAGTPAAAAVAEGGIACRVMRESGGTAMIVAASRPGATAIASRTASTSTLDAGPPKILDAGGATGYVVVGDVLVSASRSGFTDKDLIEVLDLAAAAIG